VADLARQLLDQIPAAPGRIRYIGLPEGVDARTTATLIAQTISQMTPPGGRRGDLRRRVAVIADQANNALIVTCNESDFEIVGDLVAALSQPSTTEQIVVKVYALETITADRAAESVRRMLEPGPARAPRRGRQAQRMRDLAVKLLVDDQAIEAVFDPGRVRVSSPDRDGTAGGDRLRRRVHRAAGPDPGQRADHAEAVSAPARPGFGPAQHAAQHFPGPVPVFAPHAGGQRHPAGVRVR
jgi:hypothetical protein